MTDRPEPAPVTRINRSPRARRPCPEYVVRRAAGGGWRWWLRSRDAEMVAGSAAPTSTAAGANREALRVRITAAAAPTDVVTDRHGDWRWLLLSRAGHVVAVSAIGFASHWAAERALDRFRVDASHADLVGAPPGDDGSDPWSGVGGAH